MLRKLSLCAMTLVLSACASGLTAQSKRTVTSEYCAVARPIPYDSEADSKATVAGIEAHNSQWVCLCENDCPKGR